MQDFQDQITALEASLGATSGVVAAFDGELSKMRDSLVFTGREVNALAGGISSGLRRAFDGVVFDGMKLQDALRGVAQSIAATAYNIAMKPVQNAVGGDEKLAGQIDQCINPGLFHAQRTACRSSDSLPRERSSSISFGA